jgi:hypothetical protein
MYFRRNTFLLLFSVVLLHGFARDGGKGNGGLFYFGPAVGFYTINLKHATQPFPRASLLAGYKREIRMDRDYRSFLNIGIEYFFHGLNFKSYYFRPDTIKLYDKSFRYNYGLYVHELVFPLQYKLLLTRADNSRFSPYLIFGYHLRVLLSAELTVTESGNTVKRDSPKLLFRTPFIGEQVNSYVSIGAGFQKNNLSSVGGAFFTEINLRYGFSEWTLIKNYAPASLWIGNTHLFLIIGAKF